MGARSERCAGILAKSERNRGGIQRADTRDRRRPVSSHGRLGVSERRPLIYNWAVERSTDHSRTELLSTRYRTYRRAEPPDLAAGFGSGVLGGDRRGRAAR